MTIRIDSLHVDVDVEHPRRRRTEPETISVQVHSDSLWLWDEGCQLQSEIYLFQKRDPRFGRHLADIPHVDAIHRTFTEHYIAQRKNLVGAHMQRAVQELETVIAERDGSSVYFAASGGQVKIGWSRKVSARLAQLQTGSAVPIKLLGTVAGGRALERRLHERFAHLRVAGEWFLDDPELLVHIGELAADYQARLASGETS